MLVKKRGETDGVGQYCISVDCLSCKEGQNYDILSSTTQHPNPVISLQAPLIQSVFSLTINILNIDQLKWIISNPPTEIPSK